MFIHTSESYCMRPMVQDEYVHVYECTCDIHTYLYMPRILLHEAHDSRWLCTCVWMCVWHIYMSIHTSESCWKGPIYTYIRTHIHRRLTYIRHVCVCVCVCTYVCVYIWMCVWHIYKSVLTSESCCMGPMVEDVYVHVYKCACDIYTCLCIPQNLAAWDPWDPTQRTEVLVAVSGEWRCRASPSPGKSCHTYRWVMSHIWRSHDTRMNESCHPYRCNTYRDESCHVDRWNMAH